MKIFSLKNISELTQVAKSILDFSKDKKIFCFYGELGAGKTTIIKEICRQLGVKDKGSSPTFSLVNEYHAPALHLSPNPIVASSETKNQGNAETEKGAEQIIYHLDLYRLKSESEIYDIGYEDYVFSGNYCFIEWPEKMEHLLPENRIVVRIKVKGNQRIISLS